MKEESSPTPVLTVEGLRRRYGDSLAVDGLDFSIMPGEILGLVGPNGAGKTTTLRSIAGILPIQEGRVTVMGLDVGTDDHRAKQHLSWVPDDPQPFDSLTVEEHLELVAGLYGIKNWQDRGRELLVSFDLYEKKDALGGELSRGMRQKLSLASAWLAEPKVVLLDEPLSGLDPRGIRTARQAIREIADSGVAVILSSHLLELVEQLADRILIIDFGKKCFEGTLAEAHAGFQIPEGSTLEDVFFAATRSKQSGPQVAEELE
jgi:ABC-2 type transport system ATP-binding protein